MDIVYPLPHSQPPPTIEIGVILYPFVIPVLNSLELEAEVDNGDMVAGAGWVLCCDGIAADAHQVNVPFSKL